MEPYIRRAVFAIVIVVVSLEITRQFKVRNHHGLHFAIAIDSNDYSRTIHGYRAILFAGYVFEMAELPIIGGAIRINIYRLANINILIPRCNIDVFHRVNHNPALLSEFSRYGATNSRFGKEPSIRTIPVLNFTIRAITQ